MPTPPLLRSGLVGARARRTLWASSSAPLRSSAVRSGARLNINRLVYHRRKGLGLTSLPGASALLSAVPPGLVAVYTPPPCAPPPPAGLWVGVGRPPRSRVRAPILHQSGPRAATPQRFDQPRPTTLGTDPSWRRPLNAMRLAAVQPVGDPPHSPLLRSRGAHVRRATSSASLGFPTLP